MKTCILKLNLYLDQSVLFRLSRLFQILFDSKPKLKFHTESLRNIKILDVTSVIEPVFLNLLKYTSCSVANLRDILNAFGSHASTR